MGKPPKSSLLIGFPIINHPFWGTRIFGNIQIQESNTKSVHPNTTTSCRRIVRSATVLALVQSCSVQLIGLTVTWICFLGVFFFGFYHSIRHHFAPNHLGESLFMNFPFGIERSAVANFCQVMVMWWRAVKCNVARWEGDPKISRWRWRMGRSQWYD